jgi:hypothetical protein
MGGMPVQKVSSFVFSMISEQLNNWHMSRDLLDQSQMCNADFALQYVEKKFHLLRNYTNDNDVSCVEAYAQCLLKHEHVPNAFPTCKVLDAMSKRFQMCTQIICNSVGIETWWNRIQEIQFEVSRLNRWVCDINCAVLSSTLEVEHANKWLLHQRL